MRILEGERIMTRLEIGELTLVPVLAAAVFLVAGVLPERVSVGYLCLAAFALLLLQSLLRDLCMLRSARAAARHEARREAPCMCLESTVGVVGLMLGAILALSGVSLDVGMTPSAWACLVAGVLLVCFLIKDLVINWRPLAIKRDKNHFNIIVKWR